MSKAKRRDTDAELALRRELYRRGRRYRVTYPIPGQRRRTIDVAFTKARLAVFVDGCFWHGCPEHGTKPRSNSEWWLTKLAANKARDEDTDLLLGQIGWTVIRIWEHESPDSAANRIDAVLNRHN
ncbi:T/G mismatch-specific endonuclease [Nocardioides albertanoniae]|uniref:T/G mismatch-specific endonuclease n=2 Tax=Nocardioides albertanoniae TaxID=1175486 RepID=A0A543ACQ3_9ACTN|nr:T/G mismatch-specific endonuclease [Nocardioides albertanoniae]